MQVAIPTTVTQSQVSAPAGNVGSDKPRRVSKVTSQVDKGKRLTVGSLKTQLK